MPSVGNAKISMDIQAKIVGYQQSLNKLKAQLDKIQPGSKIGKKLGEQLKYTERQYKNLSKNLNPKMTSASQIENYVERFNRLGQRIQDIADKMQQVNAGDLKFQSFGQGLKTLQGQLKDAKQALQDSLDGGFKKAIGSSTALTNIFERLKITISGKNRVEILQELKKKSQEAGKNVQALDEKLNKAKQELAGKTAKVDMLKGNPLFDQTTFEQKVRDLRFAPAFTELRQRMKEGINTLFGKDNSVDSNKIIQGFLGGLTPQNIYQRINTLRETLTAQLGNTVSAKDIYSAIFGDFGNSDNSIIVQTNIVRGLFKNITPESIRPHLTAFVESISAQLNQSQKGILNDLITKNDIDGLFNTLIQYMPSAATKLRGALVDAVQQQGQAQTRVNNIEAQRKTAVGEQTKIDQTYNALLGKVATLQKQNADKEQRIKTLEADIKLLKEKTTAELKSGASGAGKGAQQAKLSIAQMQKYQAQLEQVQAKQQMIGKLQGVVQRWFSVYSAVRMVSNAIKQVISTIQELDKTITDIAIVTNMGQDDLWGQMDKYTDLATQYAASISGVYKVSQLYYQQGLQTNDVMALTQQTLKMARISGLQYSEATDFMTNAVRSFKMEMTDSQVVVDTYAAIAASSATSVSELANAMSKTASSAQAVGSSFQNTTAMMAVMIEATRESAENIGSALKSIISRYGEMKEDPTKLVDSEGEEMNLNKVDKALKSVGITLKNTQGQFRDFDDVIMELAASWDSIDVNTQRYIATVMAGNRQQSRFLALVSSYERLKELTETAADSEDASQMQYLKTLDSVDAKTQQLQTSIQTLYTDSGLQNWYKNLLDFGNNFVSMLNNLSTVAKAPIGAITTIGTTFYNLANIVNTVFTIIKTRLHAKSTQISALINGTASTTGTSLVTTAQMTEQQIASVYAQGAANFKATQEEREAAATAAAKRIMAAHQQANQAANASNGTQGLLSRNRALVSVGLSTASLITSGIAANVKNKEAQGWLGVGSSALSGAAMGSAGGLPGIAIGAIGGAVLGFVNNISNIFRSNEDKLKDLKQQSTQDSNEALTKKSEVKSLNSEIQALRKLEAARYDSVEAQQKYYEAANKMAAEYPNLVSALDGAGNATINLTAAEQQLATVRQQAIDAAIKAAKSNVEAAAKNEEIKSDKAQTTKEDILEFAYSLDMSTAKAQLQNSLKKYSTYTQQELEGIIFSHIENNDIIDYGWVQSSLYGHMKDGIDAEQIWPQVSSLLRGYENAKNIGDEYNDYVQQINQINNYLFGENQDLDNATESLNKLRTTENLPKKINEIIKSYDDYISVIQESQTASALTDAAKKSSISSVTSAYIMGRQQTFLTQLTGASNLLVQHFYSQLTDDTNWNNFITNLPTDLSSIISSINSIWKDLSSNQKAEVNSLIKNAKSYSKTGFETALSNYLDSSSELYKAIVDAYFGEKVTTYTADSLNEAIRTRNGKRSAQKQLNSFENVEKLGQAQLQGLLSIWDSVASAYDNNKITKDQANNFIDQYDKIMGQIEQDNNLSPEQIAAATKLVSTWDDFSISGLINLAEKIKEYNIADNQSGAVTDKIKQLKNYISVNLTSEFETFTNNIVSQLEDFDKALSNATKGMDPKTAIEMANKLGLTLDDFAFKNGKYYFTDLAKVEQNYLKYKTQLESQLSNYVSNIIGKDGILFKLKDITTLIGDDFENRYDSKESFVSNYKALGVITQQQVNTLWDTYNTYWESFQEQLNSKNGEKDFYKYVEKQLQDLEENYQSLIEEYGQYTINSYLLTSGQIKTFVDTLLKDKNISADVKDKIVSAIGSGNIEQILLDDTITDDVKNLLNDYYSIIKSTFTSTNKQIYQKLITPIGSTVTIEATDKNRAILEKLGKEYSKYITLVKDDKTGDLLYARLKSTYDSLKAFYDSIKNDKDSFDPAERRSLLDSAFNELYVSYDSAFDAITKNITDISRSDLSNFAKSMNSTWSVEDLLDSPQWKNIIKWDDNLKKYYVADIVEFRKKIFQAVSKKQLKKDDAIKYIGQLEKSEYQKSDAYKIRDIVKNYNSLSAEQAQYLLQNFKITRDMLHQNADHTYSISLDRIKQLVANSSSEIQKDTQDLVYSIVDDVLSSASTATNLLSQGTNSVKSAQQFVTTYKNMLQQAGFSTNGITLQSIFDYSSITGNLQLTPEAYKTYIESLKAVLLNSEQADAQTANLVQSMTQRNLLNEVDIIGYVGSDRSDYNKEKLRREIANYNASVQDEANKISAENLIQILDNGGTQAVAALKAWATAQNKELSQSDITNAYYNGALSLDNLKSALSAQIGEVISKQAYQYMQKIYGQNLQQVLGLSAHYDEQSQLYIVDAAASNEKALQAYYVAVSQRVHKPSEILEAANDVLTAGFGDSGAADAISKAASMSLSDLSTLFGQNGMAEDYFNTVSEWLNNGKAIISNGQIKILDQNILAETFNWDEDITNTKDYLTSLKSYRDGILQYQNKIKEGIKTEISGLTDLSYGDTFNLTYFSKALEDIGKLDQLNEKLEQYGAFIANGVLNLSGTNSLGVLNAIKDSIQENIGGNNGLSEEYIELVETLNSNISSIISNAINAFSSYSGKGTIISGTTAEILISSSKKALQDWGKQYYKSGQIVLQSGAEFIKAAQAIYTTVAAQYEKHAVSLQDLNNSYLNAVKATFSEETARLNILTSSSITTEALNTLATSLGQELADIIDQFGNLRNNGAIKGLIRTGLNSYQITDWDALTNSLNVGISKYTNQYIKAQASFYSNQRAKTPKSIVSNIIPNMDKITQEQIGQIAIAFKMTYDQVKELLTQNADGTFRGSKQLMDTLFKAVDMNDEDIAKLLSTQFNSIASTFVGAITTWVSSLQIGDTALANKKFEQAFNTFKQEVEAFGGELSISFENFAESIQKGGFEAIGMIAQIAKYGQLELSSSDIATIFRGEAGKYVTAVSSLASTPGEIVDSYTAEILNAVSQGSAKLLTNGQYVVTSVVNLYNAYLQAYNRIYHSGTATLADINNTAAKVLAADKTGDGLSGKSAIDALSSASDMTYDTLASIFTNAGKVLSIELVEAMSARGLITQLGGDKLRINDFEEFADYMGWQKGGQQYVSAFKSYNDALVTLNNQVQKNITEQITNVMSAKPGDAINLTQLYSELDSQTQQELQAKILELGGAFYKGILYIGENSKIFEITRELMSYGQKYGGLLSSQMAQLYDSIYSAINTYISNIKTALGGTATNAQALNIQSMTKQLGLDVKLDFTQTAKGLQLSKTSAEQLYYALEKVDSMSASLLFDNIVSSLTQAGSGLENISATTAKIVSLKSQIASGTSSQNSQLQQQLSLYEKIAAYQKQTASSYSFMDNSLPEYLQGPKNYWQAVRKAYTAINKAAQGVEIQGGTKKASSSKKSTKSALGSGSDAKSTQKRYLMQVQDYYNIITELGNLAQITGTDLTFLGETIAKDGSTTAALIQKGFGALTNIDGQSTKIDLGKIGLNVETGAADMKSGFDSALKQMANAQIEMIDGLIAVLEVVVEMQQLGKVDVGNDNTIDLNDIFPKIKGIDLNGNEYQTDLTDFSRYTDNFKEFADNLIKLSKDDKHKDLAEALQKIKLGNYTLAEILEDASDGIKTLEFDTSAFQKLMNSLYKMYLSDDWTNGFTDIQQILLESGFEGTLELGDSQITIKQGVMLLGNKDGDGNIVYKVGGKQFTNAQDAVQAQILLNASNLTKFTEGQTYTLDAGTMSQKVVLGNLEYTVTVDKNYKVQYIDRQGNSHDTLDELYRAEYSYTHEGIEDISTITNQQIAVWKIEQGITVIPTLTAASKGEGSFSKAQIEQLKKISFEDLKAAWDKAKTDQQKLEFQAKYGVILEDTNSAEQFDQLIAKLTGVQKKEYNVEVHFQGQDADTLTKLYEGTVPELNIPIKFIPDNLQAYKALFGGNAAAKEAFSVGLNLNGKDEQDSDGGDKSGSGLNPNLPNGMYGTGKSQEEMAALVQAAQNGREATESNGITIERGSSDTVTAVQTGAEGIIAGAEKIVTAIGKIGESGSDADSDGGKKNEVDDNGRGDDAGDAGGSDASDEFLAAREAAIKKEAEEKAAAEAAEKAAAEAAAVWEQQYANQFKERWGASTQQTSTQRWAAIEATAAREAEELQNLVNSQPENGQDVFQFYEELEDAILSSGLATDSDRQAAYATVHEKLLSAVDNRLQELENATPGEGEDAVEFYESLIKEIESFTNYTGVRDEQRQRALDRAKSEKIAAEKAVEAARNEQAKNDIQALVKQYQEIDSKDFQARRAKIDQIINKIAETGIEGADGYGEFDELFSETWDREKSKVREDENKQILTDSFQEIVNSWGDTQHTIGEYTQYIDELSDKILELSSSGYFTDAEIQEFQKIINNARQKQAQLENEKALQQQQAAQAEREALQKRVQNKHEQYNQLTTNQERADFLNQLDEEIQRNWGETEGAFAAQQERIANALAEEADQRAAQERAIAAEQNAAAERERLQQAYNDAVDYDSKIAALQNLIDFGDNVDDWFAELDRVNAQKNDSEIIDAINSAMASLEVIDDKDTVTQALNDALYKYGLSLDNYQGASDAVIAAIEAAAEKINQTSASNSGTEESGENTVASTEETAEQAAQAEAALRERVQSAREQYDKLTTNQERADFLNQLDEEIQRNWGETEGTFAAQQERVANALAEEAEQRAREEAQERARAEARDAAALEAAQAAAAEQQAQAEERRKAEEEMAQYGDPDVIRDLNNKVGEAEEAAEEAAAAYETAVTHESQITENDFYGNSDAYNDWLKTLEDNKNAAEQELDVLTRQAEEAEEIYDILAQLESAGEEDTQTTASPETTQPTTPQVQQSTYYNDLLEASESWAENTRRQLENADPLIEEWTSVITASEEELIRKYGVQGAKDKWEWANSDQTKEEVQAHDARRKQLQEALKIYDELYDTIVDLAVEQDERNQALKEEEVTAPGNGEGSYPNGEGEEIPAPHGFEIQLSSQAIDTSTYEQAAATITDAGQTVAEQATVAATQAEAAAETVTSSGQTVASAGDVASGALGQLQSAQNSTGNGAVSLSGRLSGINSALVTLNPHIQSFISALQRLSEINPPSGGGGTSAKGNVALAGGTLVGQLGPELAVFNGRYHLLGQNGAEMVNLPSDAIVFNHLQTRQLLNNGSTGRGKPVTNQRNAVSFATGTFGPAKASASAALAALRQIRAMWQSMLNASAKDLGSMAGAQQDSSDSGGGGGGGGGKDGQAKSTTAEIQRWYNLTRQIDKLQQDITHQQTLRDKLDSDRIANGKAIYESRKKQLNNLTQQIKSTRQLIYLQKSWYDRKREELANSAYGKIFTYDENGLQQYTPGKDRGLDILEKLTSKEVTGELTGHAETAQKQLQYLQSIGFDTDVLKFNDDGTKIDLNNPGDQDINDLYVKMMQNFWDKVDGWQDELDSLYDSYNESYEAILEYQAQRNELLKQIVDNQLAVQNQIITAIQDREQAVIDKLQDQRDAIDESSQKFIKGLQDQLDREKKMYDRNQQEEDLNKLRRQILILQRAGGSASQIGSLQDQLAGKQKDAYFNAQQDTIDAIQEASDKELQRLDAQIDLMNDTLEYQKQHGLLWEEVTTIMQQDEEQIMQFIADNKQEWAGYSALQEQQERLDTLNQIQQWVQFRKDQSNYWSDDLGHSMTVEQSIEGLDDQPWATTDSAMYNIFGDTWGDYADQAHQVFNQILGITGDSAQAQDQALETISGTIMVPNGQGTDSNDNNNNNSNTFHGKVPTGEVIYTSNTTNPANNSNLLSSGVSHGTIVSTSGWITSDPSYHWKIRKWSDGYEQKISYGPHSWTTRPGGHGIKKKVCTKCGKEVTEDSALPNNTASAANGGMIEQTGLVLLHGSKKAPQAVLNPQQTRFLREDFLKGTDILYNTISSLNSSVDGMVTGENCNMIDNSETIRIDKAEVIMQVESISNDYDARRAGDMALEEMLKVARKSGTRGMSRR